MREAGAVGLWRRVRGRWLILRKLLLVSSPFCRILDEERIGTVRLSMILRTSLIAYANPSRVPSNRAPRGRCSPTRSRHDCRTTTEKPRSLQPRTIGITNAAITVVRRKGSRHHRLPGKAWSQKDEAGWFLGEIQMLVILVASGFENWIRWDVGKGKKYLWMLTAFGWSGGGLIGVFAFRLR